ncbi:MAG: hypothetical protein WDW38_002442 [Sanguina aurantia]
MIGVHAIGNRGLQYARDLTADAAAGLLDPVIGRDDVIRRTLQVLLRRNKSNPVLVGDAGVGKTAIVEGIAQLAVEIELRSARLRGTQLWSVDLPAMLAGSSYRGQFEERLMALLEKVLKAKNNTWLFVDEVHMLVGAGASEGGMDAANILKPLLARGSLRMLGATTPEEYRSKLEPDTALARRLQVVQVEEPTEEEALACLLGLAPRYEAHHGVAYTPEALSAAVRCAKRYVSHRRLPDSAIDLIDMAASKAVLRHANVDVSATMSRPLEPPTRQTRNTTPAATVADTPAPAPAPPAHTQGSHKLALFQRTVLREGLYDSSQGGGVCATWQRSWAVKGSLLSWEGPAAAAAILASAAAAAAVAAAAVAAAAARTPAGKSSEQQAAGGSSCKDRNVTQQADGSASCEKSSTCSNSGSCGSDSGSGSSSSGPPTIDARHTPHAAADGGRSGGAVPPDAVVSSRSLDPAVDWQEWVESQGWAGQPEEHRQKLLLWFGASPEFPIAGVAEELLRLRCRSCGARFLNIPADKLQLGTSILMPNLQHHSDGPGQHRGLHHTTLHATQQATQLPGLSSTSPSRDMSDSLGISLHTPLTPQTSDTIPNTLLPHTSSSPSLSDRNSILSSRADKISGSRKPSSTRTSAAPLVIGEADILSVVSDTTGVPASSMSINTITQVNSLRVALSQQVVGQDAALLQVVSILRMWRLGLSSPTRPAASFVFTGPAGVGKATMCKSLAEELYHNKQAVLTLNMAEFRERSSLSRLLGAPPGYIGYGEPGLLSGTLRRRPHSLVLLKNLDLAHPEVLQLLCSILSEGQLTDTQGDVVSFRHAVLIATLSPQHQHNQSATPLGVLPPPQQAPAHSHTTPSERTQTLRSPGAGATLTGIAASQHMHESSPSPTTAAHASSPAASRSSDSNLPQGKPAAPPCAVLAQLLSSVDKVVHFRPMTAQAVAQVVGLQVQAVSEQLRGFGVESLQVEEGVQAWLAERAVGSKNGSLQGVEAAVRSLLLMPATDVLLSAIATNGGTSGGGGLGKRLGARGGDAQGGAARWRLSVRCPGVLAGGVEGAGLEKPLADSALEISIELL